MADRVILIGQTTIDIKKLSLIAQQSCDLMITSEIDKNKITAPIQQTISCLSIGRGRQAIFNEDGILGHSYLNLVMFVDDDELIELFNVGCLQYNIQPTVKKAIHFVWATGNVLQFKQFVITASNNETLIELANSTHNVLASNGLRELFNGCKTTKKSDGLIVFED